MFSKNRDEYTEATEHASINTHSIRENNLGVFNLFLLTTIGVMGYVSFDSLHEKSSFFKNINILNKDKTENQSATDQELIDILGTVDINSVAVDDKKKFISLSSAINSVVNNSSLEETSPYTQALTREINRDNERVVIIKKGDTLASLSEQYYGDSMAYSKILKANKSLSQASYTIFVGQELILPY